jgi:hypothetical protein
MAIRGPIGGLGDAHGLLCQGNCFGYPALLLKLNDLLAELIPAGILGAGRRHEATEPEDCRSDRTSSSNQPRLTQ